MNTESQLSHIELSSSSTISGLFHLPKRNLGCAILVAAIEDYLSLDDQTHASAALFLFPLSPEYKEHYDWVVSMATGVDRAWLRDCLNRMRKAWDRERTNRKLRAKFEARIRGERTA
jgi:hypothetical protein